MGFVDKLKNMFFEEEEEEEIEESVSLEKENKKLEEKEVIAKKVVLPTRTQNKEVKEEKKAESIEYIPPQKETVRVNHDLIFDDEDFIVEEKKNDLPKPKIEREHSYSSREKDFYKEEFRKKKMEANPGYTETVYRKTTERKTFTPSPIISPIYGILDKNYKKEEVREAKEIRLSSRPNKMDLDSVRNKAFGDLEYDLFDTSESKEEEKESIVNEKKVYDIKEDKPMIDKVTLGEADEYFNDLGLAYDTDYKDLSKDINDGKVLEKEDKDRLEDNLFDLIESMYDKED